MTDNDPEIAIEFHARLVRFAKTASQVMSPHDIATAFTSVGVAVAKTAYGRAGAAEFLQGIADDLMAEGPRDGLNRTKPGAGR